MKRVVFFVLNIHLSILLFSQNLVVNPGFENWEKSNKPSGWVIAQNCLKDSVNIMSGSYSCKQEGGTRYLGQSFFIVPGKQFRLSFFYKTIITGTGNGCRIWCYWKDSGGKNLSDPATDDKLRPSKYLKSDSWQQFSVDFIAPGSATSFYLEVRTYQNSIAYFDDFIFDENVTTSSTEYELSDIRLYPNPVSDYLTIMNISNIKRIDLKNLAGITIWSAAPSCEESVTIPVSGFPNGVYLIRIYASGKIITRKFIKNN